MFHQLSKEIHHMLTPFKANHLFTNWFHFAATYVGKPIKSQEMSHLFPLRTWLIALRTRPRMLVGKVLAQGGPVVPIKIIQWCWGGREKWRWGTSQKTYLYLPWKKNRTFGRVFKVKRHKICTLGRSRYVALKYLYLNHGCWSRLPKNDCSDIWKKYIQIKQTQQICQRNYILC